MVEEEDDAPPPLPTTAPPLHLLGDGMQKVAEGEGQVDALLMLIDALGTLPAGALPVHTEDMSLRMFLNDVSTCLHGVGCEVFKSGCSAR